MQYLAIITDQADWRERAVSMTEGISQHAIRYPTSFGIWLNLIQEWVRGTWEIAVVGNESQKLGLEVLREYIPQKVIQFSPIENQQYPLLRGKKATETTTFFLCRNYSCKKPVYKPLDIIQLIEMELKTSRTEAQYPE